MSHVDPLYNRATAANGRRIHLIRASTPTTFITLCGVVVPRQSQQTQDPLPRCRRCFPTM